MIIMASFYMMSTNNDNSLWKKEKGVYVLTKNVKTTIADEKNNLFTITLKKGYKCDGLSVPKAFRWFLPSWDKNNSTYNLAGAIHDALYTMEGFGIYKREQCDDIFRGILRDSGISRFKAGCADKAVEWFAGGKDHWGNDDFNNKLLICSSLK